MLWTYGFAEMVEWTSRRRAVARAAAQLIRETEAFLAGQVDDRPQDPPLAG
jgi:hypothetical protein